MKLNRPALQIRTKHRISAIVDRAVRESLAVQLGLISIIVGMFVLLLGLLLKPVRDDYTIQHSVWWAFLRITDPGYLSEDDGNPWQAILGTVTILSGLLVFGGIITVVHNWMDSRLQAIRRGKRPVLLSDHIVILGWSRIVPTLIDQIAEGELDNQDRPPEIVVLAQKDPAEMQERIELLFRSELARMREGHQRDIYDDPRYRNFLRKSLGRKILLRHGDITNHLDLKMVNVDYARLVILAGETDIPDPVEQDSRVIKSLFASVRVLSNLVPEVLDIPEHKAVDEPLATYGAILHSASSAHILDDIDEQLRGVVVHCIDQNEFVARLLALTILQPDTERIFGELFSYQGNEIYIAPLPRELSPSGTRFEEILLRSSESVPIGYIKRSAVLLNPPPGDGTLLYPGDKVVWMARHRGDCGAGLSDVLSGETKAGLPMPGPFVNVFRERVLVIGRGRKVTRLLDALRVFLSPDAVLDHWDESFNGASNDGEIARSLRGGVEGQSGEFDFNLKEHYDAIALAESEGTALSHDAEIILKVLQARREILRQKTVNPEPCRIIAEFLDPDNADLAALAHPVVAVISSRMLSNYLVQISRECERKEVYDQLLTDRGPEVLIFPIESYTGDSDASTTFGDVQVSARELANHQLVIGYIDPEGGLFLNPGKRDKALGPGTRIIALAEADTSHNDA